jgi:ATP-dependent helicase HepA
MPRGTRVWIPAKPYGWMSAEIFGWSGWDSYQVQVPGLRNLLKLPADKLLVRWNRPLGDPVAAVALGFCDSPKIYQARRLFREEINFQRRVSSGYSAVLSAPVHLYQHQLDTVARVLQDPIPRYLLADEVGLGKTIVAGLIIRQLLLDDASATALIAVPTTLTAQWESELAGRLLLDIGLGNSVRVVTHAQLARHAAGQPDGAGAMYSMVVVDEAHNLLREMDRYPALTGWLHRSPGLLLLSATPVRGGDPVTLLRLLNLIDPAAYPVANVVDFTERLRGRESEATDLQLLRNHRASLRQRGRALERLAARYRADPVVAELAAACREAEDLKAPVWTDLFNHIRETYRISRRMIRHRRTTIAAEYPAPGRRLHLVPIADPARPLVDGFLDRYRELAQASNDMMFANAVMHALGGPHPLLRHLESRLSSAPGTRESIPSESRALFENSAARLRMARTDTRLRAAEDLIDDRLRAGKKVLVAATSAVARDFHAAASSRWPGLVGSHLAAAEDVTRGERDVRAFQSGGDLRVLVVDHSVEEGRNLQAAHTLLNLDLPLDFNRIEQRIGRVDRFGAHSEPAEIVVFAEPRSVWLTSYLRLLIDGIGIFDRSVSTLHSQLGELFTRLLGDLLAQGHSAYELDPEQVRQSLQFELEEIDLVEELESVSMGTEFDDVRVAELRESERDVARIRMAINHLTSVPDGVALQPVEDPRTGVVRFASSRVGVRVPGLTDEEVESVRPLLGRRATYDREVAAADVGVAPLRIGNPVVEWLDRHLRTDERGRAWALLRRYAGISYPTLWMNVDFLVEFDAASLDGHRVGAQERLTRRGEGLFPPSIIRTWVNPHGPLDDESLESVLEMPFDPRQDVILRGRAWQQVLEDIPDWAKLCRLSGEVALDELWRRLDLSQAVGRAMDRSAAEAETRIGILKTRTRRLISAFERAGAEADLRREEQIAGALSRGISSPAVSVVACGAVVLWPVAA